MRSNENFMAVGLARSFLCRPEELGDLYRDFEDNYRDTVKAITTSTIKNEAVKFSLDEYRLNRSFVEERFKSVIFDRLGGEFGRFLSCVVGVLV